VDASDSRCRCIGKIIARDLRLEASRLYRMAITRPRSRAAVTLSSSLSADLLGCINRTREKERKGKEALYNHATYVLVRNHKSRYRSVALRATFQRIRRTGKLHLQWQVVKTHADAICTGPRSKEEKKREEKRKRNKNHPKVISSPYLDFLTHARTTIITVARISA